MVGFCSKCAARDWEISYLGDHLCLECYLNLDKIKNKSFEEITSFLEKTGYNPKKNYYFVLWAAVRKAGKYSELVKNLPDFYILLSNIVSNTLSGWYTKLIINSALAYLVLDFDVIPDDQPDGYIDDLFIVVYVLKFIRDKISKDIILNSLTGTQLPTNENELWEIITNTHSQTEIILGNKTKQIIKQVGLSEFNLFDFMYLQETSKKMEKEKEKKNLIYSMLAVQVATMTSMTESNEPKWRKDYRVSTRRLDKFENYITKHPEYHEIKRIWRLFKND